jgi:fructokinase
MRIGIDLGGKDRGHCAGRDGLVQARERVPTPQAIMWPPCSCALVAQLEQRAGVSCSVVSHAGLASRATGLVKNSNSVCLNGMPLHADLEQRLHRPLRFANDADCFALSEASITTRAQLTFQPDPFKPVVHLHPALLSRIYPVQELQHQQGMS